MENSPLIRKQPLLNRVNLRNWTKYQFQFWRRLFFFGGHLILGDGDIDNMVKFEGDGDMDNMDFREVT